MSSLETNGLQQDKTPEEELQACAAKQLTGLGISGLMTLEAIEFQLQELDSVLDNCQQLHDKYAQLITNVPAELHSCFQVSAMSTEQLAAMINLIQSAPPALWSLRDHCFSQYEMDFRLSKLQQHLDVLKPLKKKLQPFVNTNEFDSSESLRVIQDRLDSAGMFCWFSTSWRKAKKQALALAVNKQLKLADIKTLFPAMIKFINTQESVDELFAEEQIIADCYQGINTDLTPLLTVREWYKDVEFAVTAHFANEEGILNGLSALDKNDADKLAAVYTHDLTASIKTIDKQMNKLRLSFPECQALQQGDTSYLKSVSELKSLVVAQLSILKNGSVNTGICLSKCC